MKILVIGASGFIGGALVDTLRRREHQVVGTARRSNGYVPLDVTDRGAVEEVVSGTQYDAVVNLAATGVTSGSASTDGLHSVNVLGAQNVAAAVAALAAPPWFVHAASSTEPRPALPSPGAGESPYSRSKHAGTSALREILHGAQVPHSVVRIHNTYGPGQPPGRFVRDLIDTVSHGLPFLLRHPNRVRDFCYIDDVAELLADVVERRESFSDHEIGSGVGMTLRQAAQIVVDRVGGGPGLLGDVEAPERDPYAVCVADPGARGFLACRTSFRVGVDASLDAAVRA